MLMQVPGLVKKKTKNKTKLIVIVVLVITLIVIIVDMACQWQGAWGHLPG